MPYWVVIEKTKTGYSAYVPDLPGCIAAARTRPSVRRLIREAIELHVADLRELGQQIPRPTTRAELVSA